MLAYWSSKTDYPFKSYGKNNIKFIWRQFYSVIFFLLKTRLNIIQNRQKFDSICKRSQKIRIFGKLFQKIKSTVFALGSENALKGYFGDFFDGQINSLWLSKKQIWSS